MNKFPFHIHRSRAIDLVRMAAPNPQDLTWTNPCLLLVDDDLDDALFFELALKDCARNVAFHHTVDGAEAMAMLERNPEGAPDLILTDLKMPGVNGFQMLRDHAVFSKVPVIVFSSSGELVDRERAFALGAKDYHVKPAGYQKLVAEVRDICWWLVKEKADISSGATSPHSSPSDWSGNWDEAGFAGALSADSRKPVQHHGLAC